LKITRQYTSTWPRKMKPRNGKEPFDLTHNRGSKRRKWRTRTVLKGEPNGNNPVYGTQKRECYHLSKVLNKLWSLILFVATFACTVLRKFYAAKPCYTTTIL
jgi:hypothetical protein